MKTVRIIRLSALLGVLAAAACQDSDPLAPAADTLSMEDQIALEVVADPEAVQAALDLVTPFDGGMMRGRMGMGGGMRGRGNAGDYAEQARAEFGAAEQALAAGDHAVAAQHAREARRTVAEGIQAMHGGAGVTAMVERMEDVAAAAAADSGIVDGALELGSQMEMLAGWAREALRRGDLTRAGALGVLAEQRVLQCGWSGHGSGMGLGFGGGAGYGARDSVGAGRGAREHRGRDGGHMHGGTYDPEFAVGLGATAVDLATRLLTDPPATEEQEDFLATAANFQARAEDALLNDQPRRAAHFAGLAQWQALKAVVLPGGITDEEIRAMDELATSLFQKAQTAVGPEPTELQQDLLEAVDRLIEMAENHMGQVRIVIGPLWRAAVISQWLIG